jgi:hypothetical protein
VRLADTGVNMQKVRMHATDKLATAVKSKLDSSARELNESAILCNAFWYTGDSRSMNTEYVEGDGNKETRYAILLVLSTGIGKSTGIVPSLLGRSHLLVVFRRS